MDAQTVMTIAKEYIPIALAAVGVFALIATKTPNKTDNMIVQLLYDIINLLGGNFGNAKNKE